MAPVVFHRGATRQLLPDAGTFAGGGRKFLVHTTEGPTLEGAFATLKANRSAPHFILEVRNGRRRLVQCIPINRAGRSLQHPSGPETNRANCIQVEVVGFTSKDEAIRLGHPELFVGNWEPAVYRALHRLMKWSHRNFDVPMRADHPFPGQAGFRRLGGQEFFDAVGLVGHCHAAGNDHGDPGSLKTGLVLPWRGQRQRRPHAPAARLRQHHPPGGRRFEGGRPS